MSPEPFVFRWELWKFRWIPSLGGWLTMVNCAAWLMLVQVDMPYDIFVYCELVLALPAAWPLFVFFVQGGSGLHGPTANELIATYVIVGMNSFLWGYGLAGLIHAARRGWWRIRRGLN